MTHNNWMHDNAAALKNVALKNICLPATHDSGAYELFTAPSPGVSGMNDLTYLIYCGAVDPLDHTPEEIAEAEQFTIGSSQTNALSITKQLNAGIRCLDFRLAYYTHKDVPIGNTVKSGARVYHALVGNLFEDPEATDTTPDMVMEVAAFLKANPGEIVYMTVGHFYPDEVITDGVSNFARLYQYLLKKLGDYMVKPSWTTTNGVASISNDVFLQTYGTLTTDGTKSRVVVVVPGADEATNATTYGLWPGVYSPPDGDTSLSIGPLGGIFGAYTNTWHVDDALKGQSKNIKTALTKTTIPPFALYMTVTEDWEYISYYDALDEENQHLLFELVQHMDGSFDPYLYGLIMSAPSPYNKLPSKPGDNFISILYADFFDTTNLVDNAINLTLGQPGLVGYSWLGKNSKITNSSGDPTTDAAPVVSALADTMCCVFKPAKTQQLNFITSTGAHTGSTMPTWTAQQEIAATGTSGIPVAENTCKAQAEICSLAPFGKKLMLAYPGKMSSGDSGQIAITHFSKGTWKSAETISVPNFGPLSSDLAPGMCAYNNKLYLAYVDSSTSNIQAVSYTASKKTWTASGAFTPVEPCGAPFLITYAGVAKDVSGDVLQSVLYCFYRGTKSGKLYVNTLTKNAWGVSSEIMIDDDSPKSNAMPTAALLGGEIYILYEGNGNNYMYQINYKGVTYTGDRQIQTIANGSSSDNGSQGSRGPAVTYFKNQLAMILKNPGSGNNLNQLYYTGPPS